MAPVKAAWAAGIALAALVGFGAGALGITGRPAAPAAVAQLVARSAVPAFDCPRGEPVASLAAGDRVLVVGRTSDGDFLAVRNPGAGYDTVWVSADTVDTGPIESTLARAGVPIDDCVTP